MNYKSTKSFFTGNRLTFSLTCLSVLAICYPSPAQTIDFDELTLASNSFFDGYGSGATTGVWTSQGAQFNTNQFGFPGGWSYSNVADISTAGFENQFAAVTETGLGGSGNYAIGTTFDDHAAFINLPSNRIIESLFITNSTYAALSMERGDGFAKKFGGSTGNDEDFFKVTFTGFSDSSALGSTTGAVEFYLADFRPSENARDYIVSEWTFLDLQPLGSARSVGISFESSDVSAFGINTPAYVAIDNLVLVAVPEPSAVMVIGLVSLGGVLTRRRRTN